MGIDTTIVKRIIGIPPLKFKDGIPDFFLVLDFDSDFLSSYEVKGKLIGLISIILKGFVSKANAIEHLGGKVKEMLSLLIIAQVGLVNRCQKKAVGKFLPIIHGITMVNSFAPNFLPIDIVNGELLSVICKGIGVKRSSCDDLKSLLRRRVVAQNSLLNIGGCFR